MSDPYNEVERICMLSAALKDVGAAHAGAGTPAVSEAVDAVARLLLQLVEKASSPTMTQP